MTIGGTVTDGLFEIIPPQTDFIIADGNIRSEIIRPGKAIGLVFVVKVEAVGGACDVNLFIEVPVMQVDGTYTWTLLQALDDVTANGVYIGYMGQLGGSNIIVGGGTFVALAEKNWPLPPVFRIYADQVGTGDCDYQVRGHFVH